MFTEEIFDSGRKITPSTLIECFDATFVSSFKTRLLGGFESPFYAPASEFGLSEIRFTGNSTQSALHEVAHWCVAGSDRRKQPDYGYWYRPDGRTQAEQKEFFELEIVPQALEWAFSLALDQPFEVSCDNLNEPACSNDIELFKSKVQSQLEIFQKNGFPKRAQMFLDSLAKIDDQSQSDLDHSTSAATIRASGCP